MPDVRWHDATLAPVIGSLHANACAPRGSWRWASTIGGRNRLRRGGLAFCPACLGEDPTAYFRRTWRLAWHTLCEHHDAVLTDRCPRCGAPAEPHRLEAVDVTLDTCATCKHTLVPTTVAAAAAPAAKATAAPAMVTLPGALSFQRAADRALLDGGGVAHGQPASVPDWFAVAAFHAALVRRAARPSHSSLRRWLACLGLAPIPLDVPDRGIELESLPAHARHQVLAAAWPILATDRTVLVETLIQTNVTRGALFPKGSVVPAALVGVADALSERTRTRLSSKAVEVSGPRSRRSVEARFARLARQLERKR